MPGQQENIEVMLGALASKSTRQQIQRNQRKTRWAMGIALLCVALYAAYQITTNLTNTWAYIQRGDWWGFITFIWPVLALLLGIPGFRWEMRQWLAIPGKASGLREQLHNEQRVPLAADQPAILQGDELPYTAARIGPLKRWKASMIVSIIFCCFFLLLGLGSAWGLSLLLTTPGVDFQPGPDLPLIEFIAALIAAGLIILGCCGGGIGLLIAAARASRGAFVTADDWGLRWRARGSSQRSHAALAWSDVQGFYRVTYRGKQSGDSHAYLLDGPQTAFLWRLTPKSGPAERAASERLACLIVTRAHLPLRDLTGLLTAALEPQPLPIAAPADAKQP